MEHVFVTPFGSIKMASLPGSLMDIAGLPVRKDGLPDRRFGIVQDWEWSVASFVASRWANHAS